MKPMLFNAEEEFWTHIDRRIRQLGMEFLEEANA